MSAPRGPKEQQAAKVGRGNGARSRSGAAGGAKRSSRKKARTRRDEEPISPALDFMRLLWAVDHGLDATSKQMAQTIGLTGPQRLVLRFVARHPGISAGALAGLLFLHPSTLTGVLARLDKRGLLARKRDPGDARRMLLELTENGRTLDVPHSRSIEAAVERALTDIVPEDLSAATKVLTAIARALLDGLAEDHASESSEA